MGLALKRSKLPTRKLPVLKAGQDTALDQYQQEGQQKESTDISNPSRYQPAIGPLNADNSHSLICEFPVITAGRRRCCGTAQYEIGCSYSIRFSRALLLRMPGGSFIVRGTVNSLYALLERVKGIFMVLLMLPGTGLLLELKSGRKVVLYVPSPVWQIRLIYIPALRSISG